MIVWFPSCVLQLPSTWITHSFVRLMVHFTGAFKSLSLRPRLHSFSQGEDSERTAHLSLPLGIHTDRLINEQQNVSLLSPAGSLLLVTGLEECGLGLRSEQISPSFPCWRLPDLSCRWEVITTQPLGTWAQGEGKKTPLSHIRLSVSLQTLVNAQCQDPAHGWEVL